MVILIGLALLGMIGFALGRDLGQWEQSDPATRLWFQQLRQPDTMGNGTPGTSCCGETDAYWADEQHVRDGKVYAVITDDRPDDPLMRMHEAIGTEYEVPPQKVVGMEQRLGNPTGHTVVFLGVKQWISPTQYSRPVLCYVQTSGV
jgi:hypothetical protein